MTEIALGSDEEVRRGLQILEGKVDSDFSKSGRKSPGRSPKRSGSPSGSRRPRSRSKSPKSPQRRATSGERDGLDGERGGLELARRRLVVVKEVVEQAVEGEKHESAQGGQGNTYMARIYDHGEHQKEAVRRLFHAHVNTQSYREELHETRGQILTLQKKLSEENRLRKMNEGLPRPLGEQLEDFESLNIKKHAHWLRNDPPTRRLVGAILSDIIKEGQPSRKTTGEHLWLLTYGIVLRWLGSPDEDILKQITISENRTRKIRRDALREHNALRDSMRLMERKLAYATQVNEDKTRRIQDLISKLKAMGVTPAPSPADILVPGMAGGPEVVNLDFGSIGAGAPGGGGDPNALAAARASVGAMYAAGPGGKGASGAPGSAGPGKAVAGASTAAGNAARGGGGGGGGGGAAGGGAAGASRGGGAAPGMPGSTASAGATASSAARAGTGDGSASGAPGGPGGPGGPSGPGNRSGAPGGPGGPGGPSGPGAAGAQGPGGSGSAGGHGSAGGPSGAMAGGAHAGTAAGHDGPGMGAMQAGAGGPSGMGMGAAGGMGMGAAGVMGMGAAGGGIMGTGAADGPREFKPWEVRVGKNDWVTLDISAEQENGVDNELFEPLDEFDDDMRELLIDVVNEKVRRILLLDHSKFENGKLPYGLKHEQSTNDIKREMAQERARFQEMIVQLEKQVKEQQLEIERLMNENAKLRADLEAALNGKPVLMPPPPMQKPPPQAATPTGRGMPQEPQVVYVEKEAPPPMPSGGKYSEKDLQAKISEAMKELRTKMAGLETENKKLQKRIKDLEAEIARLKNMPVPKEEKPPPVVEAKPDPKAPTKTKEVQTDPLEDKDEVINKMELALKSSQGMLRRVLAKVDETLSVKTPASVDKTLEKYLGMDYGKLTKSDGTAADLHQFVGSASAEAHQLAAPVFTQWVASTDKALEAFKNKPKTPRKKPPPEVVVQHEEVRPPTPEVIDHSEEVEGLRKKCQKQQDEISRLLLIIEELRRRFEELQNSIVAKGGPVAEEFTQAVGEVGLTALVEARPGAALNLKNVYERLYQDAIQRMQRLALIMEQKAAANELYLATMACAAARKLQGVPPPVAPDLQRLTEAALTAINGMWYHYDILFRRVCEGSAKQGVKDSANNTYRLALADCFATTGELNMEESKGVPSPFAEALWEGSQSQSLDKKAATFSGGKSKGFKAAAPGAVRPAAPLSRKPRGLEFEAQTPFQQYISKMREAPIDNNGLPKPRKAPRPDVESIGALCGKKSGGPGLTQSLSLPALPRSPGAFISPQMNEGWIDA